MTASHPSDPGRESGGGDDRPPFGSWPGLYLAVILNLILLILAFLFVQRSFR